MIALGGMAFGLVIGYLAWYAVKPSTGRQITISVETISAFIGVVGGLGIISLFPTGTDAFAAYCFGLCVGFFFTPASRYTRQSAKKRDERVRSSEERQQQAIREEAELVESNWPEIEKIVRKKLERRLSLGIYELAELPYTRTGKLYILQKFAQCHIEHGVELSESSVGTRLLWMPLSSQEATNLAQSTSKQLSNWSSEPRPPLCSYQTTYELGDDRYDMSFSIENEQGDFLGECGFGISETIGEGDPSKVTAFEAWLFDKDDLMTLTKVLMSQHAYNDVTLKDKLATKGELLLAKHNGYYLLRTQNLRLRVKVTELTYGSGVSSPENSFFRRITVLMGAWQNI